MAARGTRERTPAAVVIGLDSITGLQTARILARRGIPVVGIARTARHPACRTSACDRVVLGRIDGEDLVALLDQLSASFARAPVLFPCTDLSVLALSAWRDRISSAYRAVLPEPGIVELLVDKARFHSHAVAAGLPVPPGYVVRDRADAETAAGTLRFPCVLKPAIKTTRWDAHAAAKVVRVATPAHFLDAYDRHAGWADAFVAQEWMDGPDRDHVTCNAYFDSASRLAACFVSRKLRQWPLDGGVGCLSEECEHEEAARETARVFQGVGHHGLAYLEMKRDPRSGRWLIIEPNVGRPTGRSAAADAAGVELLYTHYRDAQGLSLPPPRERLRSRAKWIYFRQDCQSAYRHWRRGDLRVADYARSLRGCRADAVFSWRDPLPFAADLWRALGKAAGRGTRAPLQARASVDHDIHGVVGLRLVDATAADAAVVARQVGLPRGGPLTRDPDIVVRFVDELPIDGLRWIEVGRTGFTGDGFIVLQSGRRPARARLALERVDGRFDIVCQRGLKSVPFLMAIVTVAALEHGCAPLHASAFRYQGTGVLVTGWAKGGKTEALLAFAAQGAEYIGDEWVLLTPDGRGMYGLPEQIRLQDWHLDHLPAVARAVPASRRLLFKGVRALDRLHRLLSTGPVQLPPVALLGEALPAMRRQLNVQVDPLTVFGDCPSAFAASPDKVFFMVSDEQPTVRVTPADPGLIARRMAASVSYEQLPLRAACLAYRFAFPDRRTEWLERAERRQEEIVGQALAGKHAFVVHHPYPVQLGELFAAMAPACSAPAPLSHSARRQVRGDVSGGIPDAEPTVP